MRTELIEAFNIWIKVPAQELAIITKVVKMLHTSSLLYVLVLYFDIIPYAASAGENFDPTTYALTVHGFRIDDIEDDSVLRRGEPGKKSSFEVFFFLQQADLQVDVV